MSRDANRDRAVGSCSGPGRHLGLGPVSRRTRTVRARALDGLLAADEVLGHDLVEGELLTGDTGGRGRLLADYAAILRARTVAHDEVVQLIRHRRLQALGIGWIDAQMGA
jgi:hypothetical protein